MQFQDLFGLESTEDVVGEVVEAVFGGVKVAGMVGLEVVEEMAEKMAVEAEKMEDMTEELVVVEEMVVVVDEKDWSCIYVSNLPTREWYIPATLSLPELIF